MPEQAESTTGFAGSAGPWLQPTAACKAVNRRLSRNRPDERAIVVPKAAGIASRDFVMRRNLDGADGRRSSDSTRREENI